MKIVFLNIYDIDIEFIESFYSQIWKKTNCMWMWRGITFEIFKLYIMLYQILSFKVARLSKFLPDVWIFFCDGCHFNCDFVCCLYRVPQKCHNLSQFTYLSKDVYFMCLPILPWALVIFLVLSVWCVVYCLEYIMVPMRSISTMIHVESLYMYFKLISVGMSRSLVFWQVFKV